MAFACDTPYVQVGKLQMTVAPAERSAASEARWASRKEALIAWLLSEWNREQERKSA